ncbi:MAG: hypothetical protein ABIR83_04995 [Nakamurella sp.]
MTLCTTRPRSRRWVALVAAAALSVTSVWGTAAASASASASAAEPGVQAVVDAGVDNAAAQGIRQGVTVVDRADGTVLASHNGEAVFNSESILKLFTAAYYLIQADGQPDEDTAGALRTMIAVSDDTIQSDLWRRDIVPTIADRYGLVSTTNANNASSRNWGSGKITPDDQARFLWGISQDQVVGPWLMQWMAASEPTAADGFDQTFGLNAVTGDHGSKQGWSDFGWSPYNIHSVGWTGRFFVAVLQSSTTAGSNTMKATSTFTAQALTDLTNTMYPPAIPPEVAPAVLDCDADEWLDAVLLRVVVRPMDVALSTAAGTETWCAT